MAKRWRTLSNVKDLLRYKVTSGNDQWDAQAVKSLVKRLKKANKGTAELEKALAQPGVPSNCVTIPRNQDGRLQVNKRKLQVHLIYCRLWRWPDLRSYLELRAIPSCEFAHNLKKEEVCINPYHYNRIVKNPAVPPVTVPRTVQDTPLHALMPSVSLQDESQPSDDQQQGCLAAFSTGSSTMTDGAEEMDMAEVTSQGLEPSAVTPNRVEFEEPAYWCSISYYEMATRVGEAFQAANRIVSVDGFTDPSDPTRFCLGRLTSVNRSPQIENVRNHIGFGIQLLYIGGDVIVECLGENSVFAQSAICNHRFGWHMATVCKVPPGCSLTLFNNQEFAQLLAAAIYRDYETVQGLARMCTVRLSFIKGWGADYPRHTVSSTPCWIEIHLNGALLWLDRVLTEMGSPSTLCSSRS